MQIDRYRLQSIGTDNKSKSYFLFFSGFVSHSFLLGLSLPCHVLSTLPIRPSHYFFYFFFSSSTIIFDFVERRKKRAALIHKQCAHVKNAQTTQNYLSFALSAFVFFTIFIFSLFFRELVNNREQFIYYLYLNYKHSCSFVRDIHETWRLMWNESKFIC